MVYKQKWLSNKDLNIKKMKKLTLSKWFIYYNLSEYICLYQNIYFISSYYILVEPSRLKQIQKVQLAEKKLPFIKNQ